MDFVHFLSHLAAWGNLFVSVKLSLFQLGVTEIHWISLPWQGTQAPIGDKRSELGLDTQDKREKTKLQILNYP